MPMIEKGPSSSPARVARLLSVLAGLLLGILLVVLFARSAEVALGNPPSFDGAMNLQVAASIAAGQGYRRNYAAREPFPHEIQTGPPYILPAAAVFKIWGIGIPQAEIVNVVYAAALLIITCWLIAPLGGLALALFGALTVLMLPGLHQFGFYGYGEIPALVWALAAMGVYFRGHDDSLSGLGSGVLLGLAVFTKTVLLIGAGALGLSAILEMLVQRRDPSQSKPRRFGAFVVGGSAVIVTMEIWRASALGGFGAWQAWWVQEGGSIFMQAGVKPGFGKVTHSLLGKLHVHFGLLGQDFRLSSALTGLWLALVFAAVIYLIFFRLYRRKTDWLPFAILLTAFVYLAWWLLITPTEKTWLRRIMDGMICADIGLFMVGASWLRGTRETGAGLPARSIALVSAGMVLVTPATWTVKDTHALMSTIASERSCGLLVVTIDNCVQQPAGASVGDLLRVAAEVHSLPSRAYLFGFAWYSAPRVGLFSQRHFLDFHDVPVAALDPSRPVYFVQGYDTPPESLARIRSLYGVPKTPDYTYALIHAHSLTPALLTPGTAPIRRYIQASDHYAYLRGFNDSEGANGRWLTDDNQVLLAPRPGDAFELTAFVLPAEKYEVQRPPRVIVSFDRCVLPPRTTQPGRVNHLVFSVPPRCGINMGEPVTVRIEVDDLVRSAITHDPRALGILAKALGFRPPGAAEKPSARSSTTDLMP